MDEAAKVYCCILSVMVEVRNAGGDRAAGYWEKLV